MNIFNKTFFCNSSTSPSSNVKKDKKADMLLHLSLLNFALSRIYPFIFITLTKVTSLLSLSIFESVSHFSPEKRVENI